VATVRDANFDKEQRRRCPFHPKSNIYPKDNEEGTSFQEGSKHPKGHAMASYILLAPNTQIGRPVNEINT
jgi:hypothetical protein